jgi:predicted transposase YbfD/YdcC
MTAPTDLALTRHLAALPDPRVDRTKKHLLGDILLITLCATIAGADSWPEVERFGRVRLSWLQQFLKLPNGIPSHDTFRRLFARIDPKAFNRCMADWMAGLCEATGLRHVAIDGKAARSAKQDTFCGCLFLVNAWATENRLILGQEAVAEGSNEIGAIPELLRVLSLKGALVTIDAAGCQKDFAEQIRQKEADFLLCVKGNQPDLEVAVQQVFDRACEADFVGVEHDGHEAVERSHGRHEERYTTVIYDPQGLPPEWPDVAAVILVGREREIKGERTDTSHYYITSRRASAAELGQFVRRHWSVENELHWSLDVTFGEDKNRTTKGHAGTNLSLIRKVALSLLKQDPSKGSINSKRLNAALDEAYMLQVLRGFGTN